MPAELRDAVDRLVGRVQHWTPSRWERPSEVAGASRADLVHALAQRLADAGADAEGEVRRAVPRLDNDLALPDQIRVLASDALAGGASPEVIEALAADVTTTASHLG